mgnify:CR=1 FL=1
MVELLRPQPRDQADHRHHRRGGQAEIEHGPQMADGDVHKGRHSQRRRRARKRGDEVEPGERQQHQRYELTAVVLHPVAQGILAHLVFFLLMDAFDHPLSVSGLSLPGSRSTACPSACHRRDRLRRQSARSPATRNRRRLERCRPRCHGVPLRGDSSCLR